MEMSQHARQAGRTAKIRNENTTTQSVRGKATIKRVAFSARDAAKTPASTPKVTRVNPRLGCPVGKPKETLAHSVKSVTEASSTNAQPSVTVTDATPCGGIAASHGKKAPHDESSELSRKPEMSTPLDGLGQSFKVLPDISTNNTTQQPPASAVVQESVLQNDDMGFMQTAVIASSPALSLSSNERDSAVGVSHASNDSQQSPASAVDVQESVPHNEETGPRQTAVRDLSSASALTPNERDSAVGVSPCNILILVTDSEGSFSAQNLAEVKKSKRKADHSCQGTLATSSDSFIRQPKELRERPAVHYYRPSKNNASSAAAQAPPYGSETSTPLRAAGKIATSNRQSTTIAAATAAATAAVAAAAAAAAALPRNCGAARPWSSTPTIGGVRLNRTFQVRFNEVQEQIALQSARRISYRMYRLTAQAFGRVPPIELGAGFP